MTKQQPRVSVVGGGAWGVALAAAAAGAGSDVLLYSRRGREIETHGVTVTRSLADVGKHGALIILAVPSGVARVVARELGDHVDGHHQIVHGVRGLVSVPPPPIGGPELATVSAVLRDETPAHRFGALGGPVLTEELAAGAPSVMVVASRYPDVIAAVRAAFSAPSLRLYSTDDLVGLEWASALTGVLAVAVGYARGVGLGGGLISAFVTRGVHEAARVAGAAGAEERTFTGLGGFGDILATLAEEARPEVRLGEAIARGETIERALTAIGQRIEAIELAPKVAQFAKHHRVESPILQAVAHGILAQKPPQDLVQQLMTAPLIGNA
jgi:glycerol-3-phosphate dehydrogenase (NAD(P)+)